MAKSVFHFLTRSRLSVNKMDDVTQIISLCVGITFLCGLSYGLGWWARGDYERSKRRNLQPLEGVVVAT